MHILCTKSSQSDKAIEELRIYLQKGLTAAFHQNRKVSDDSIQDYTQESLVRILNKLDSFKGNAQFKTWCMKIAVNLVLSDLRKKRWKNVALDDLEYPDGFVVKHGLKLRKNEPEQETMIKVITGKIEEIVSQELTDRQRHALGLVVYHNIPLQELAERLGINRGALYKLLHDARKKIRDRLIQSGFSWNEIGPVLR